MTAPDKLQDIKPGDRVRVTFEGVALASPADERFTIQTTGGKLWVEPDLDSPPSAERIEPPLAVGCQVKGTGIVNSRRVGELMAINADRAWVRWNPSSMTPGEYDTLRLSDMERIA